MSKVHNFTQGKIFAPLVRFAIPVLCTMFLQVMYGAVDMFVIGQFASSPDVSATATGSQVMVTITSIINGFAMGITILIGQKIGQKRLHEIGDVVGSGICILMTISTIITLALVILPDQISSIMHAPEEAFGGTVDYIRICGAGTIFIVGFNALGAVFRGIGDPKTPLITVSIACIVNIVVDIILVVYFSMGVIGVAIATIFAQAISVILSILIIKKRGMPFEFSHKNIKFHKANTIKILQYGAPIAIQDGLVKMSFLSITSIVNSLGLVVSAGIGVAQRFAAFIMLVPVSVAQSIGAFSAQNFGAKEYRRARKALRYGIAISFSVSIFMSYFCFFHGNILSSIFSKDPLVTMAAWDYMKPYAIDCLLTSFMFSLVGFFNGYGKTTFIMIQGIIGAFGVRVPVSYFMSTLENTSLFYIGLATPMSTFVQVILCITYYIILYKKYK